MSPGRKDREETGEGAGPLETYRPGSGTFSAAPTPPPLLPDTGDGEETFANETRPPREDAESRGETLFPRPGTEPEPGVETPPISSTATVTPVDAPTSGELKMPLAPGRVLFGKYLLVRKLGEGGMGEVWLVKHTELDTERALKMIVAGVQFNAEMRSRFRREAWVMARFSHPNAVVVHDAIVRPDGNAYIEMEYVRGESLNKWLEPGVPVPLACVARLVAQFCDVLQLAHEQGIIHRDLKPSNLMLLEGRPPGEEHLKVLDFGIAKILGDDRAETDTIATRTGTTMGTPQYMSPEQIVANPGTITARSDLYAVGLILYEMLTGSRPFESKLHKLIYDHMETPPPPFAAKRPGLKVPAEVERLVLRCLEKDPARRPQSARELAEAFRAAANLDRPAAVESPGLRSRGRAFAAFLTLAGALALGTFIWPKSVSVPPGCVAAPGAALERIGGRYYPRRIERLLPSGARVPFLLIKKEHPGEPDPFYIMETKVWNDLFAEFARTKAEAVKTSDFWRPIALGQVPNAWNGRLPALNLTCAQAHECAQWLGGELPSVEQWDKAAGLHNHGERVGPYLGTWSPGDKTTIAVGRSEEDGPLPVGSAPGDISPSGCRDMAGNGLEWSRTPLSAGISFPPPPESPETILMRGQTFTAREPLRYDKLQGLAGGCRECGEIGFRVVIDVDD